jgi:hypothetical protein
MIPTEYKSQKFIIIVREISLIDLIIAIVVSLEYWLFNVVVDVSK